MKEASEDTDTDDDDDDNIEHAINLPRARASCHSNSDEDFGDAWKTAAPENKKAVFVDAESMKAKIRENAIKKPYDVSMYYHEVGRARWIATHPRFEQLTLSIIAVNAIWLSIDTDLNVAPTLVQALPIFQFVEHFFAVFFTFEWTVRFCSFQRKINCCRDGWMVFDTCLVFLMVAESWILSVCLLVAGPESASLGGGGVLKLARLMRLSRMARMARLLRALPELLIMIKGMGAAMRSVMFTLILLGVFIYVFGIAFRQLTNDTDVGTTHFPGVIQAMHTLLLDGTLLDSLGTVLKALGKESFIYVVIFYMFVLLSAVTVMNMLIGILCEIVSAVAATERETIAVSYVRDTLFAILESGGFVQESDDLNTVKVTRNDFAQMLTVPMASKSLSGCGVDVFALIDNLDMVFAQASEGLDGQKVLKFVELVDIILSLRGSNTATVKDCLDLRKHIRDAFDTLRYTVRQAAKDFQSEVKAGLRPVPPSLSDAGVSPPGVPPSQLSLDQKRTKRASTGSVDTRDTPGSKKWMDSRLEDSDSHPQPPVRKPQKRHGATAEAAPMPHKCYIELVQTVTRAQAEVKAFLERMPGSGFSIAQDEPEVTSVMRGYLDVSGAPGQVAKSGTDGSPATSFGSQEEAWLLEELENTKSGLEELQKSLSSSLSVLSHPFLREGDKAVMTEQEDAARFLPGSAASELT
eukprot:TRINITY_DN6199_c1_g1_i1.p1 TRINITY_DN6199_c1_g1~~TRINITY_DN6199_c1_g1_i1.p1  ORF type:complete len:693 (-),score=162.56 TRINITY_DN6199_c1_g1_i1:71-2149(-)